MMIGRIPCINPSCRRTAPAEKYEPGSEIICGKCFKALPAKIRTDNQFYWRQYNRWERRIKRTADVLKLQKMHSIRDIWSARIDQNWDAIKAAIASPEKPATQPPAAWIGGKRTLAPRLVEMIGKMPHQLYAEPFVGMGGVFFRRRQAPRTEVINDRNGDVVNLFRILQRHYPQFMDTLKFQITSRREFDRLKSCDPSTLTDLERAARFIYLQKLAFGGKVDGQNFGVQRTGSARFNLNRLAPLLEDVHERLAGVVIENLDWLKFIDRYDRLGTLFYLDPPYWGCEDDYGKSLFGRDQFAEMADRLKRLQGGFIMSINDVPEIREIFDSFRFYEADLKYSVCGGAGAAARELIICG